MLKCSRCGSVIENLNPALVAEIEAQTLADREPLFCDACEAELELDADSEK